ncbi:hypothetical protein [Azospirillum ramasamyi]|uniref:Uncharacterized protein n=1 Tax=Azospirillum ramasamyi TaxID=682998 RepID=A0A2U9SEI5_9PROT|nr:hypothetical protein [Azospirillum ramasamyi]AWU97273.1 hypothetical protein DM194_23610 [Azospirillum ramasamyi]
MQILKALVVIMGVMIIAGSTFLGVEVYKRMSDPNRTSLTANAPAPAQAVDVTLDVPAGSRIGEVLAVGNRVLFKVTLPEGADRLYLMDPRNGAVTATITAGPISGPDSGKTVP